jgi:hypothetical protein
MQSVACGRQNPEVNGGSLCILHSAFCIPRGLPAASLGLILSIGAQIASRPRKGLSPPEQ